MKKVDYKKDEKEVYSTEKNPHIISLVETKYFTIEGIGNPNEELFQKNIEALYTLSYGVKMSYKKSYIPKDYYEYTVYPLEGFWDITDDAKLRGTFDKNDFKYKLMIKQPNFVNTDFFHLIKTELIKSKKNPLLSAVNFEVIDEGLCLQMLHLGSYDDEPHSFALMEEFCKSHNLMRKNKVHKEIYLSDARKVDKDKLKTILRFQVEELQNGNH